MQTLRPPYDTVNFVGNDTMADQRPSAEGRKLAGKGPAVERGYRPKSP